ncbi:MAG: biotin--[acetyl-CoA-carboxylase] ligase [Lachnospiraceae bacterium]|nr:biotin--[acetyl-CoA-carboxylase] ligase [Lachnospiraceae bacterium]
MKAKILELLRRKGDYVSGQELCELNNVSRTAVWKAIKALEKEGYHIEAVRNRGYRLVEDEDALGDDEAADIFSKNEISSRLDEAAGVKEVVFLPCIDSTNSEAARRAESSDGGVLVVSEEQTAGRGRRGRSWNSPAGSNVYFSLMIKPDLATDVAPMLTLIMALAVCRGMEKVLSGEAVGTSGRKGASRPEELPMIKWPNDIVFGGKKCCGMLTEMSCEEDRIKYVVIGVGINVREQDFPDEIKETAVSLEGACGKKIKRSILVAGIMNEFGPLYERFLEERDLNFARKAYFDRLINSGRKVRVLDPKGEYEGTCRGISERGELLVEVEDGNIVKVNSGEVSVRGVYGYV